MWCSRCGDEFRPGFTMCADCAVELVAERPTQSDHAPTGPFRPAAWDHAMLEYDFSDWTDEQRAGLDMHLQAANIASEWEEGGILVVPRARRVDVDDFVDLIEGGFDVDTDAEDDARASGGRAVLASPGRRIVAGAIDELVYGSIGIVVNRIMAGHWQGWWSFPVIAAYLIVTVALWGRTVGNLVVGTRVEHLDGSVPGWRTATVRWAVPVASIVLVPVGGLTAVLGAWVWYLTVHLPIFFPSRRGLHDRAAGTIVTRTRAPFGSGPAGGAAGSR